ncbi:MAG: DUF1549 domain-containing protein [Pirellulaceae bacterium]|nr:DUF1549 domain-containing protein [Pirellulaceae bacterium]
MRSSKLFILFLGLFILGSLSSSALAQSVTSLQGRTLRPGQTKQLTLQGADFNDSLRVVSNRADIELRIVQVEPTRAVVEATPPAGTTLGPVALQFAFASGAMHQSMLLVDDLEPVVDAGNNHGIDSAQSVSTRCTIEGTCDASVSDFYRVSMAAGESLSIAVHTQALRSPMDPVVRLLDANGSLLTESDDDQLGPDCAFSYRFEAAGDCLVEIHDSRNSASGAPYQLRIGDFPVAQQAYPPSVAAGATTTVAVLDRNGQRLFDQPVELPPGHNEVVPVTARAAEGQSASWIPVWRSQLPQHIETVQGDSAPESAQPPQPLSIPVGISGRLENRGEVDSYRLLSTKGQAIRITAHTRSVGSATLLRMQLFTAADALIAETKVSEADEWSLEAVLPEDGEVRLQVTDLLQRGGAKYTYALEIAPASTFAVALKADAAQGGQFPFELEHGAAAIDLQIARFGYDGAIDLSWVDSPPGIRIVNPRIAAAATTARIYLAADSTWQPHTLTLTKLQAIAADVTASPASDHAAVPTSVLVGSRELRRLKEPFLVNALDCLDGALVFAAADSSPSPYTFQPAAPIQFARPLSTHAAVLALQRTNPEFKAGVELMPFGSLPAGILPAGSPNPSSEDTASSQVVGADWKLETKIDKDTYSLTIQRPSVAIEAMQADEPTSIPLVAFAQFNGRGQIQAYEMPIEWIDPVKVRLEFPEPMISGGTVRGRAIVSREGTDSQPVTLSLVDLPTGFTSAGPIGLADDQSEIDFELAVSADATLSAAAVLTVSAKSQYGGDEFSITAQQAFPPLLASPQELSVYPSAIELHDASAQQQIVVTGVDAQAAVRDWTRHARLSVANPELAEVRQGVVYPLASGQTELVVQVGSQLQSIPLTVNLPATPRRVDFESEVLVALSKQGCNSGACHGSPSGKGGFRLSLRAFDLQFDELTLIHEEFGRRTNPLAPEQSLLLLKPTMKVPHGGGKQLHIDSASYKILREWVAQGATADPPESARIARLEVFPNQKQILSVADGGQQLAVTAHFSDGRQRDVTHLVAYESSDGAVATVTTEGWVQPHKRGEVAVLVRCLEYIEAVPLMFVEDQADFQWSSPPQNSYVDTLVDQKLQQLQYLPAERCNDSEFLRRVSLDVIGILPSVEETTAFLADTRPDKRARFIDALLDRPEYSKFWALKWGDLLKLTGKSVGDEGVHKYYRWLEASLRDNQPYDQFARELLTGSGSTLANPPANFYRTAADMNESVETISQVFLGARLQCAKCHNHPFERWTQDNYYGLGAFFNRVERRKTQRPGELFIYFASTGEVTQPRTGEVMQPWLPKKGSIDGSGDSDRRLAFADWLVAPDNPFFARIEANRLWSHLFARGIVDPIDDFRDSNPPSNAALLDALAKDFVESGYDRKHLLRVILNSRTYQASYQTSDFNRGDTHYFSHQEPRLLGAEQLLDAINHTLSLTQTLGNLPAGTLATQMPAPDIAKVDFLKVFGQPERSTVCACERADSSNLGMAIELFNGPMMHDKLRDANNRFRVSLAAGKSVVEVIQELYLAGLCRLPSDIEIETASAHCASASEPSIGLEDVCWALFNTDEFLFQH